MNILIVDDIPTNRKLLRVTLEAEGHVVIEAADGVESLVILEREKIDAIISDILMPNMDGFRLCHEVRKNPAMSSIPFIVYTSTYNSPADMKLAEDIGADRYILKPAPLKTILDALHELTLRRAPRGGAVSPPPSEIDVMKQYSQALVNKLEEKNTELQQALQALQRAHDRILELNESLEDRVRARTAELETTNRDLTAALANVKELAGMLPICSYCKKVRDDKNYWQEVESYVTRHSRTIFSHAICPECFETKVKPLLDELPPMIE